MLAQRDGLLVRRDASNSSRKEPIIDSGGASAAAADGRRALSRKPGIESALRVLHKGEGDFDLGVLRKRFRPGKVHRAAAVLHVILAGTQGLRGAVAIVQE